MINDPPPKLIPHSVEAEEAVLGAILINPDSYFEVEQHLQAEDFFIHRNWFVWEAITRLNERHTPIDFLTITEELDKVGHLYRNWRASLSQWIDQSGTHLTACRSVCPDHRANGRTTPDAGNCEHGGKTCL